MVANEGGRGPRLGEKETSRCRGYKNQPDPRGEIKTTKSNRVDFSSLRAEKRYSSQVTRDVDVPRG